VLLRIESTVRQTGKPLRNDAVHVWRLDGSGKVSRYRHHNDTAAEIVAWRG
jgi:ketosteroid isomerase-like protein